MFIFQHKYCRLWKNYDGDCMYFNERIKWIRECENIKQKDIADYLGIKQQQYARYEKGINIMPITYLKGICEYLNVSADYIIGLTDIRNPYQKK